MRALIFSVALCIFVSSCYTIEGAASKGQVDIHVSPVSEQDPQLIRFSAQFPSTSPSNLHWDFGDGYSNNQQEITHRYLVPGNYQATLHYSFNDISYEKILTVNILGEKSELLINTHKPITLDSDNNDMNQPFIRNNISPQTLKSPIQLSGILMQPKACQAGRLCKEGDLNDRFSFHLDYGDTIQLDIIKGTIDVTISSELEASTKSFDHLSNQLVIPASQLGQGQYSLNISLNDNEEKAQYILTLQSTAHESQLASKDYQPGKLIVMWKNKPQPELIDMNDPRLINLKELDIHGVKSRLMAQPDIANISLNYIRRIHGTHSSQQWPLIFQDINALWAPLAARGDSPGSNIIVAVIDTGIYSQHPNFQNLVFKDGFDFISDPINALDGNGWDTNPEDPGDNQLSYHGSHVTGIIAAQPSTLPSPNNITGLAWGATIMPLRVLGADGGTSYDLIQALRYAAGLKNDSGHYPSKPADIINLSLGGIEFSAAEQATINEVIQSGAIIVAASGNQGREQVNYPAAYQNVIAVGATNSQGSVSTYSNSGQFIDLVAPGGECLDTTCSGGVNSMGATGRLSTLSDQRQPKWVRLAGTSMAAAHISAMLGIARSYLPALDAFEFTKLLKKGQVTLNSNERYASPTFNQLTGWGALDSKKLLELMDTSDLNLGGIWANQTDVALLPSQQTNLTLTTRGSETPSILQASTGSKELKVELDSNILKISANADFQEQEKILVSGVNMKPLTVRAYPHSFTQQRSTIHHLYIKKSTEAGSVDIGRALQHTYDWHAFIETDASLHGIQASTDIDYDGVHCEPGEFCAFSSDIKNKNSIVIKGSLLKH